MLVITILLFSGFFGSCAITGIGNAHEKDADFADKKPDYYQNSSASGQAISEESTNSIEFWDKVYDKYGLSVYNFFFSDELENCFNENSAPLLLDGLKHGQPPVRWYSCYKVCEYYNSSYRDDILAALRLLLDDPDDDVREAAGFALSIFDGNYESNYIVRFGNSDRYVFTKYNEARYNDGKVWLINNNTISLLYKGSSIADIPIWSPDGKWVAVPLLSRTWTDVEIINAGTLKPCKINLWTYINENSEKYGFETGSNTRADPYINLLEWSPDSTRALLSYQFTDDRLLVESGIAVYNVTSKSVEKFMKLSSGKKERDIVEKPANFKW